MKEKLTNNLGLKLLSIGAAFFVWLVVVNISNPVIVQTKDVTVEVVNDDLLARKQLTYDIVEKNTVTIRYEIHTLDAYKIHSSDFRAYIDLADLYEPTGSVSVQVEVLKNKELLGRDISSNITAKPEVLHVKTEPLQRKGFSLQPKPVGEPESGYDLGTTTLSVGTVYAKGPESLVGQINSIGVEIDVEGANSDKSGTGKPKLYDANGNELTLGDRVTLDVESVAYHTQILKVKNLTLDFDVAGEVMDGYRYTGVECDVKSVPVVGLKSALASVNTLVIPGRLLNLDGASEDRTVNVDLAELLPENTSLAGEVRSATVVLKVEALEAVDISLRLRDITLTGALETYQYSISPEEVVVRVEGLREDLEHLKISDLHASLDVTGWLTGTQKGNLKYDLDQSFEVVQIMDFDVTVAAKEPGNAAGVSSSETDETAGETEILSSESEETGGQ